MVTDEHKIRQVIVLLKAKVAAGALEVPMSVELAAGAHSGWEKAAHDYLIARQKGESYSPPIAAKPNWEEEANG